MSQHRKGRKQCLTLFRRKSGLADGIVLKEPATQLTKSALSQTKATDRESEVNQNGKIR